VLPSQDGKGRWQMAVSTFLLYSAALLTLKRAAEWSLAPFLGTRKQAVSSLLLLSLGLGMQAVSSLLLLVGGE
jgi:hypothetical protein